MISESAAQRSQYTQQKRAKKEHFLSHDVDVCHTTHVLCNHLISYLLTGYLVRTEKY